MELQKHRNTSTRNTYTYINNQGSVFPRPCQGVPQAQVPVGLHRIGEGRPQEKGIWCPVCACGACHGVPSTGAQVAAKMGVES
eukprot:13565890-Heterocapsa_arctica.AAC.1